MRSALSRKPSSVGHKIRMGNGSNAPGRNGCFRRLTRNAGWVQTNNALKLLGTLYSRQCIDIEGLHNPVDQWRAGGGRLHPRRRRRIAPPVEVLPRWHRGIETAVHNCVTRDTFRFGLNTGVRRAEVFGFEWVRVDLTKKVWADAANPAANATSRSVVVAMVVRNERVILFSLPDHRLRHPAQTLLCPSTRSRRDSPVRWRRKKPATTRDGCPSRGETSRHGLGVSANATVRLVRPRIQESSPRAGHEAHFVINDGCAECLDLIPVPGCRPFVVGFAVRRPDFRLGIQIEQDGSERAPPLPPMHLASQCEGVLEQLCRVQVNESLRMVAQPVSDTLVSAHLFAPDRTPVGIAQ